MWQYRLSKVGITPFDPFIVTEAMLNDSRSLDNSVQLVQIGPVVSEKKIFIKVYGEGCQVIFLNFV
jgi:hypothetical protein